MVVVVSVCLGPNLFHLFSLFTLLSVFFDREGLIFTALIHQRNILIVIVEGRKTRRYSCLRLVHRCRPGIRRFRSIDVDILGLHILHIVVIVVGVSWTVVMRENVVEEFSGEEGVLACV